MRHLSSLRPIHHCLIALLIISIFAAALMYSRGRNPFSNTAKLEELVSSNLADVHHADLAVVEWGPHRIGEHSATIRVRYVVGDQERDELYVVYGGAVQEWRANRRGGTWCD